MFAAILGVVLIFNHPLIEQLGHEDFRMREAAHKQLTKLEFVSLLKLHQKHPDLEVRRRIERILRTIEINHPYRLNHLIDLLGDKDKIKRADAFYAIMGMGKKAYETCRREYDVRSDLDTQSINLLRLMTYFRPAIHGTCGTWFGNEPHCHCVPYVDD